MLGATKEATSAALLDALLSTLSPENTRRPEIAFSCLVAAGNAAYYAELYVRLHVWMDLTGEQIDTASHLPREAKCIEFGAELRRDHARLADVSRTPQYSSTTPPLKDLLGPIWSQGTPAFWPIAPANSRWQAPERRISASGHSIDVHGHYGDPTPGADQISKSLTDLLASHAGEVTLCLLGNWGSGKSYITKQLSQQSDSKTGFEVISVETWKFESNRDLYASVASKVYEKALSSNPLTRVCRTLRSNILLNGWSTLVAWKLSIVGGLSLILLRQRLGVALGLAGLAVLSVSLTAFFRALATSRTSASVRSYAERANHLSKLGDHGSLARSVHSAIASRCQKNTRQVLRTPWLVLFTPPSIISALLLVALGMQDAGMSLLPIRVLPTLEGAIIIASMLVFSSAVLSALLLQFGFSEKPIVVIIDDLDRRERDDLPAVIQNVKSLILGDDGGSAAKLIFCLDESELLDLLSRDKRERPERKIQKLFSHTVRVPAPNLESLTALVKDLCLHSVGESLTSDEQQAAVTTLVRIHNWTRFSGGITPRWVKSLLANYQLSRSIVKQNRYEISPIVQLAFVATKMYTGSTSHELVEEIFPEIRDEDSHYAFEAYASAADLVTFGPESSCPSSVQQGEHDYASSSTRSRDPS